MTNSVKGLAGLLVLAVWMPFASHSGELEDAKAKADAFESHLDQTQKAVISDIPIRRFEGNEQYRRGKEAAATSRLPMAKDAFGGLGECATAVNARFPMRPRLEDAVSMLGPCMQAVSRKYDVRVKATGMLIRPDFDVTTGLHPVRAPGIGIYVHDVMPGNSILQDLRYSVRSGDLLTYPVRVIHIPPTRSSGNSSLQSVVDGCTLSRLIAPLESAMDFVKAFGQCLKAAPGLRITNVTIPPDRHVPMHVWVFSTAAPATVEAMNGAVDVPAHEGTARFQITAYRDLQIQPFGPTGEGSNSNYPEEN